VQYPFILRIFLTLLQELSFFHGKNRRKFPLITENSGTWKRKFLDHKEQPFSPSPDRLVWCHPVRVAESCITVQFCQGCPFANCKKEFNTFLELKQKGEVTITINAT
jgi:hypothetical protein